MSVEEVRQAYARSYSPDAFMRFYRALADELLLFANPSRPIPISPVPVFLEARFQGLFAELVSAIWEVLADPLYRRLCAEGIPDALADPARDGPCRVSFDPARSIGCIDLHLDAEGLNVIEFMALPPGMSGIYPGMLARYAEYLEQCIPGHGAVCFPSGWDQARCEEVFLDNALGGTCPERVAVIDWEPEGQVTYGEFRYAMNDLWARHGIAGVIADPREVETDGRGVLVRGLRVDRILNRLTLVEWKMRHREIPVYTRLLWEAPDCFVYHPYLWYLGDKNSLSLLSDPGVLRGLSVREKSRERLREWVPPTFVLSLFRRPDGTGWDLEGLIDRFGGPSKIVLKPASSHASKGIFYGPADLPTVERLRDVLAGIDPENYVAMKLVPPPEIRVPRGGGEIETWKYDVRVFVLNGQYAFPGGRIYLGDFTNQVPCRAFAPLFFV